MLAPLRANWCFLGASHGHQLTLSVLTVIEVVVLALQTGMGSRFSKVPQPEVREQSFKAKPVTQRPWLAHQSTQVDGSRIPETGLAQGMASTV